MSQKNDDFFQTKKEWSMAKDAILGKYLRPYFQKLIAKGSPICYVDCFAGKGKFDDGNDGSPLIALDCINTAIMNSRFGTQIYSYFIELNHHIDLNKNVKAYIEQCENAKIKSEVIAGKFEDNIDGILGIHKESTVFLYVDPYGIKAIDVDKFNSFKLNASKSVEMLINFNTWGFFREACRVLKADFTLDPFVDKYLVEYNPNNDLNRDELNKISGGDFWISIVQRYKNKEISANEAEFELSKGIALNFNKKYKYVLNVPIKSNDNVKVPKYRLYYLTNHEDGCILMADNMYKEIKNSSIRSRNGQLSLFEDETDTEGDYKSDDDAKKMLLDNLTSDDERIEPFICRFLTNIGLVRGPSDLRKLLKDMEKQNRIVVTRIPNLTETGKVCTAMTEDKGRKIYIRRK